MKKAIIIILLSLSVITLNVGVIMLLKPKSDGYKRQDIEESIAEQYLKDIGNGEKRSEENDRKWYDRTYDEMSGMKETDNSSEVTSGNADSVTVMEESAEVHSEYADDQYCSDGNLIYTPDYAMGYLQCVLEIPKEEVQIRRGVYSGTKEEIAYDLSIWMVTAARPDYVLGETHYVIYGHNHTVQDLSFNRLRNICVGDEFYLTDVKGKRTYEVIGIHKMTREDVAYQIVDNFYIPSDYCYIVTCGRDDFRYCDLVVEGKLKEE